MVEATIDLPTESFDTNQIYEGKATLYEALCGFVDEKVSHLMLADRDSHTPETSSSVRLIGAARAYKSAERT
jgi:hypothetical protein